MKSIKWILVAALVACGGESYDGEEPAAYDETEQQGDTLEQPITVLEGYGYNATNTLINPNGNYRCQAPGGGASDNCHYPADKSRRFCVVEAGMSPGQVTEIKADIDAILPTMNTDLGTGGWSFTRDCSSPDVNIGYQDIPDPQAKTSILGYVRIAVPNRTNLTEAMPYPGNHYRQNNPAALVIDRTRILADFVVQDQQRVRRHALYGGMYTAGAGLGFTPAHTNRVTSIAVTSGVAKQISVSTKEKCLANTYDPTFPNNISAFFGGC